MRNAQSVLPYVTINTCIIVTLTSTAFAGFSAVSLVSLVFFSVGSALRVAIAPAIVGMFPSVGRGTNDVTILRNGLATVGPIATV